MAPKRSLRKKQWWFRTIKRTDSHYQKNHKRKAQEVKTYKKGFMKLGHPADCNSKKGNSSGKKERDDKKRGLTNPQQKKE